MHMDELRRIQPSLIRLFDGFDDKPREDSASDFDQNTNARTSKVRKTGTSEMGRPLAGSPAI
jgi:hypothetical protein